IRKPTSAALAAILAMSRSCPSPMGCKIPSRRSKPRHRGSRLNEPAVKIRRTRRVPSGKNALGQQSLVDLEVRSPVRYPSFAGLPQEGEAAGVYSPAQHDALGLHGGTP